MTVLIIFAVLLFLSGEVIHQRVRHNKRVLAREKKALAERRASFSWAAAQVMDAFESLPEAHRPSMNVEAAVRALDTKHGVDSLNAHFRVWNSWSHYSSPSFECSCVYDPHDDGRSGDRALADECLRYPEFAQLIQSVKDIKDALQRQEDAIADREHQMVLAGIESDLNSISIITAALRAERDLINDVTKEIA